MRCTFDEHRFHDIDQLRENLKAAEIEPIQLSRGRLNLGFSSLAFEDVVITRIECNRKVSDRFHMDADWLLLVVLMTPQQWDSLLAPPESLVVIAPGTEYRNSVPEGFRCVEAAIRLDLADEIGLGYLCHLKGAEAILPMSTAAARRAEHRVNRLLGASSTKSFAKIGDETGACLREGCMDFLRFLRDAACAATSGQPSSVGTEEKLRFSLAEDALQIIDTAPAEQVPSVEALATALNTTRRTLLNAFQETLGTSPSRYMLARRLNGAQRDLLGGGSQTVTNAALDSGFEHFGRFAHHYRTLFGETPSATLMRAKLIRESALT